MESINIKDDNAAPEEILKNEENNSADVNERNNRSPSPPPNCSICLGSLINTSFTDSCLHQFCFTCLLQWSTIRAECPLCKQCFKSIIHSVRSEEDYDQYHVEYPEAAANVETTATSDTRETGISTIYHSGYAGPMRTAFAYSTTIGAPHGFSSARTSGRLLNPEAVARREQIPSVAPRVSSSEIRPRRSNPIDYRRTVYRHGAYAEVLTDAFGRLRECSADYYRRNPDEINRLIPWLNRELQVLLNNNQPHIAYVLNIITDSFVRFNIGSIEFHNIVRPYFGVHTEHFAHELQNFARSNFDLVGYDQAVVYNSRRGLSNQFVGRTQSPASSSTSTSSSDSDVLVVDNRETIDLTSLFPSSSSTSSRRLESRILNMPGSSNAVPRLLISSRPLSLGLTSTRQPDILTISSSSSENECEVIGYLKPRHERTPEIIDLSSSDGEEGASASQSTLNNLQCGDMILPQEDVNLPSTSTACDLRSSYQNRRLIAECQLFDEEWATSSESNSDETDSDYNPAKSRHKSASKKISKRSSKKHHPYKKKNSLSPQRKRKDRRDRSLSSSGYSDGESTKKDEASSSSRGKKRRLSNSLDEASPKKDEASSSRTKKVRFSCSLDQTSPKKDEVSSSRGKKRHFTNSLDEASPKKDEASSSRGKKRQFSSSLDQTSPKKDEVSSSRGKKRCFLRSLDQGSPKKDEASSSRGKKRHFSSSLDEPSLKKTRKRSKKSKKSKSSKKSQMRSEKVTSSSNDSSSSSDECCSSSNDEGSSRIRIASERRKQFWLKLREKISHPTRYSSDEDTALWKYSSNEDFDQLETPRCTQSDAQSSQPNPSTSRSTESEMSDYWLSTPSTRRSSVDSLGSRKNLLPCNKEEIIVSEDEDSHHTPPVSDDECKIES